MKRVGKMTSKKMSKMPKGLVARLKAKEKMETPKMEKKESKKMRALEKKAGLEYR